MRCAQLVHLQQWCPCNEACSAASCVQIAARSICMPPACHSLSAPMQARVGVTVLAATNRPDCVDPALVRPGRFDRLLHVPPPDEAGRRAVLAVHTRRMPLAADVDLQVLQGFGAWAFEPAVEIACGQLHLLQSALPQFHLSEGCLSTCCAQKCLL